MFPYCSRWRLFPPATWLPKAIFNRERVIEMRQRGASIWAIAKQLGVERGTVLRTLPERSRTSYGDFETWMPGSRSLLPSPAPGHHLRAALHEGARYTFTWITSGAVIHDLYIAR